MIKRLAYSPKPEKQLKTWYNAKVFKGLSNFVNYDDFKSWYDAQEKTCHYCGLEEEVSQLIVLTGTLTSNRFPYDGVMSQGRCRGVWLEIDRIEPKGQYSRNNSVLCCYFCNNDKSDVFNGTAYKLFHQNRAEYLRNLWNKTGIKTNPK